jgi:hypothetical protein
MMILGVCEFNGKKNTQLIKYIAVENQLSNRISINPELFLNQKKRRIRFLFFNENGL